LREIHHRAGCKANSWMVLQNERSSHYYFSSCGEVGLRLFMGGQALMPE
jgi:hypothetical protein